MYKLTGAFLTVFSFSMFGNILSVKYRKRIGALKDNIEFLSETLSNYRRFGINPRYMILNEEELLESDKNILQKAVDVNNVDIIDSCRQATAEIVEDAEKKYGKISGVAPIIGGLAGLAIAVIFY